MRGRQRFRQWQKIFSHLRQRRYHLKRFHLFLAGSSLIISFVTVSMLKEMQRASFTRTDQIGIEKVKVMADYKQFDNLSEQEKSRLRGMFEDSNGPISREQIEKVKN